MTNLPLDLTNCSFSLFAEACVELRREGVAIEVETAIKLAPHLKEEIESLLPAMLMLDNAVSPPTSVPVTVCGCTIEEEIGRGAMGVVYRGFQPEFDRRVAIKILKKTPILNDSFKRFEVERQALGRLEHPNIVRPYAWSQDSNNAYLIMQFVDGISLEELCTDNYQNSVRLSHLRTCWHDFANLAKDIASALHHAHSNGMVHRDIKPSNLLLDRRDKIWVADFGLAKLLDQRFEISQTGAAVGTPRYMAPEQIQGTCDARSDIYSLGVSLVHIATGEPVTPYDDREELLASLASASVPSGLAQVIEKACRPDPDSRFQSAAELEIVLERFQMGTIPDRRSRLRRGTTTIWDKFCRRTILFPTAFMVFIVATILFAAFLIYTFAPRATKSSSSRSNKDAVESLSGFAQQVVGELGDEWQLSNDERTTLNEEIEGLIVRASEGRFDKQGAKKAAEVLSNTSNNGPLRFAQLATLVVKSEFSIQDKKLTLRTLRRFAYCYENGLISDETARLEFRKLERLAEIGSREELFGRIRRLEQRMDGLIHRDFTPDFSESIHYSFPKFSD